MRDNLDAKPRKVIQIQILEKKALELLLQVKPTAEMPRQSGNPSRPKKRKKAEKAGR